MIEGDSGKGSGQIPIGCVGVLVQAELIEEPRQSQLGGGRRLGSALRACFSKSRSAWKRSRAVANWSTSAAITRREAG